jgi:hypothetical protein
MAPNMVANCGGRGSGCNFVPGYSGNEPGFFSLRFASAKTCMQSFRSIFTAKPEKINRFRDLAGIEVIGVILRFDRGSWVSG